MVQMCVVGVSPFSAGSDRLALLGRTRGRPRATRGSVEASTYARCMIYICVHIYINIYICSIYIGHVQHGAVSKPVPTHVAREGVCARVREGPREGARAHAVARM